MGALLPPSTAICSVVSPASIAIVVVWLLGRFVINRVRKDPRWSVSMPGSRRGGATAASRIPIGRTRSRRPRPWISAGFFVAACVVTLMAGVALEISGNTLADRAGVSGVVFGATVLAAATALPEFSSGIAAVRLGDHALAVGDIFGGNAFQVCLFLLADLIAGAPLSKLLHRRFPQLITR
jgi:cation:H+ antiporter